jgi:hypothetical protein
VSHQAPARLEAQERRVSAIDVALLIVRLWPDFVIQLIVKNRPLRSIVPSGSMAAIS